jgi:hypothetical protein
VFLINNASYSFSISYHSGYPNNLSPSRIVNLLKPLCQGTRKCDTSVATKVGARSGLIFY